METIGQGFRPWIKPVVLLHLALCASCLTLLNSGCGQNTNRGGIAQGTPIVRVLLLENQQRAELGATEMPSIRVGTEAASRLNVMGGSSVAIVSTGSGWKIGEVILGHGDLWIEPASEGSVSINGHAYRGKYRLIAKAAGKFDVINDVDVDSYLMGVLAKEMYAGWHDEAYRAQAIVARTYALYVARTASTGSNYDLFADTRSQVYGGISGESAKSRSAVEATRGVVVAYGPAGEERIFKAYFSSCCGGITQSASAAFGDPPSEPLSEQNIGPRCSISPKFSWPPVVISKSEITRRLHVWGAINNSPVRSIGLVSRVDLFSANQFGRPASFTVTDTRGYRYKLGCEDFRLAVNTDATDNIKLPSSFCNPINEPSAVRFADGHGLGHGVGLCQWCAQQQASSGISHAEIVLQAFPKSVLVQAY